MKERPGDNSDPFGIARAASKARAEKAALETPKEDPYDHDEAYCVQSLVIAMYLSGLKVGMGVMPDGMAIYIRLSMPAASEDDRSGHVAFVVGDEPRSVLNKAVQALEAKVVSNYWKPDRFAVGKT